MKTTFTILFMVFIQLTIFSQDSLNCRLLATTGEVGISYGLGIKDEYALVAGFPSLQVIDVSNIYSTSVVYDTALSGLNKVFINGDIGYIASYSGIFIYDLIDMNNPKYITFYPTSEIIETIFVKDDVAYLGTLNYSFIVLDVSDPKYPNEIARVAQGIDDVWEFDVKDTLLFVASEDTGLKIFDISNPAELNEVGSIQYPDLYSAVSCVRVKNDVAYVSVASFIYSINISNPANPQVIQGLDLGGNGKSMVIENNFLYRIGARLTVIDISNPADMQLAGYYSLGGIELYVKNKLIFISSQIPTIAFIQFDGVTSVSENELQLTSFNLYQNYPNPFNPSTTIFYKVPGDEIGNKKVIMKVYNILGNEISTLVNEELSGGEYSVDFDATNLPSGVYFYRLNINGLSESKKMLLLK